jgi:hypothetical protein
MSLFFKRRFYVFFCFLIPFFIFGLGGRSQAADYSINLDYGKVKPIEAVRISKRIPAAIGVQKADGLLAELNPALTGPGQRTLPLKRLKLFLNQEFYQLTDAPLTIPFSKTFKNQNIIGLAFDLNLNPEDYPGTYQGKVVIRPWVEGPQGRELKHSITIHISVQIQPWVRIETLQNAVNLEDTSYAENQIQNNQPLVLRIASNTSWILFYRMDPKSPPTAIHPEIMIQPQGNQPIRIIPAKSAGSNSRKDLALGGSTTTAGGYWSELSLTLIIPNFTKHVSQNYSFPLHFAVELWDGRSG